MVNQNPIYTIKEKTILDTNILGNNSEQVISFELFSITHSDKINWNQRKIIKGEHITDVLLNFNHYTYPKILKKLNIYVNSKDNIIINPQIQKYSEFKSNIFTKLKEYYKLKNDDISNIVIAPMLILKSEIKIGIFILNNAAIIKKITKHLEKESFIFLSKFSHNFNNKFSLIKNIYFQKKVSERQINYNHYNHTINLKDKHIPLPIIINNIGGYFPSFEVINHSYTI